VGTGSSPVSFSSSSPKESLLFMSCFFFFFFGGPSLRGVELLGNCDQSGKRKEEACALTHPSVTSPVEGVALLELPDVNLPSDLSCASRSFCSRTSARRLRKSERWTRPTVCDLRRSSAEVVWLVNERGVELWLCCSEGGMMYVLLMTVSLRSFSKVQEVIYPDVVERYCNQSN
jgi:hypothetical protein